MTYLIASIILFFLAYKGYKNKKLNDFRIKLKAGDQCRVFIGTLYYDAEIEDISGSIVYVVITSKEYTSFNNRFHITEIYPPLK